MPSEGCEFHDGFIGLAAWPRVSGKAPCFLAGSFSLLLLNNSYWRIKTGISFGLSG
jgi:hypothetical protein